MRAVLIAVIIAAAATVSCINILPGAGKAYEPIVVITFDDAHHSVYETAFPLMKQTDSSFNATHFLPATYAGYGTNTTLAQLKDMEANGWETGGHGYTHENLSSVPVDSIREQVKKSYEFLSANGLSCQSFAYPYGNYNSAAQEIVKTYFKNIRTSHDFQYVYGVDRLELGYYAVRSSYTADDLIARVERARMAGAPLVIIGFHFIVPDSNTEQLPSYWFKEYEYKRFLCYLKDRELRVLTMNQAMKELCE